ncbi:MAG TPA: riboflavin synthase [Actinomycetota bacterium]|nr:riboflavin synthase [Actinomycetota bacterium]
MFTGIVESLGEVVTCLDSRLVVAATFDEVVLGESIAVDGVCLTVSGSRDSALEFDLAEETARRTTLGQVSPGTRVNLERSLRIGDRLGGHIMQGHVDGVAVISGVEQLDSSKQVTFAVPPEMERYLIEKGSVAVDGISLTVAGVAPGSFWVAMIPETSKRTTLGSKRTGDNVNIEIDQIAKYIEKLMPGKGV